MTAQGRRVVDRVLDLAVFGPLGFALEARRLVPELAARGRQHVDGQVEMVRAAGRLAIDIGRQAIFPRASVPGSSREHATDREAEGPLRHGRPLAGSDLPVRIVDEVPVDEVPADEASVGEVSVIADEVAAGEIAAGDRADLDESVLPIDGYDALAASQIVARLGGLDRDALRQVERYERAHRGRKTILHRVAQLLATR